jgi:hypothetical protein
MSAPARRPARDGVLVHLAGEAPLPEELIESGDGDPSQEASLAHRIGAISGPRSRLETPRYAQRWRPLERFRRAQS